jgi:hypothetical protein
MEEKEQMVLALRKGLTSRNCVHYSAVSPSLICRNGLLMLDERNNDHTYAARENTSD